MYTYIGCIVVSVLVAYLYYTLLTYMYVCTPNLYRYRTIPYGTVRLRREKKNIYHCYHYHHGYNYNYDFLLTYYLIYST